MLFQKTGNFKLFTSILLSTYLFLYMNAAHATWQFANEIKIGDVVFVKKGRSQIIGRGVVTSEYEYLESDPSYPHRRLVNWTHKGEWPHPGGQAVLKTLTDITP